MEQLYILMPDARVATETDPPPFRLQDLPDELQIKVYQKYFEGTRLKLDKYEGSANKLLFSGMPSLNVELVCRDMHIEARKARSQQTHRYLITCETHMLSPKALDLFTEDARYVWIREHIDMLLLRDIARPLHEPMDWDRLVERCPRLQRVTLLLQRPLWRANQLKIADEYCPASFTYVRSRDRVKTNLRKQLRMEEHSARIMEAFDPDALCRILAQRTPQYRVVLFSANMFTDAGSIDLYRAVSLCKSNTYRAIQPV